MVSMLVSILESAFLACHNLSVSVSEISLRLFNTVSVEEKHVVLFQRELYDLVSALHVNEVRAEHSRRWSLWKID